MYKVCNVKPDNNTCCGCMDGQVNRGIFIPCSNCELKNRTYELLQLVSGIKHDYAFVLFNGIVEKVPLDRIFNVKDRFDAEMEQYLKEQRQNKEEQK